MNYLNATNSQRENWILFSIVALVFAAAFIFLRELLRVQLGEKKPYLSSVNCQDFTFKPNKSRQRFLWVTGVLLFGGVVGLFLFYLGLDFFAATTSIVLFTIAFLHPPLGGIEAVTVGKSSLIFFIMTGKQREQRD